MYVFLMTLRKKSLALGSTVTLAGGATGASLLAMLLAASPAGAVGTTYTVDTLADGANNSSDCITPVPGSCSLRDAVDAATDGDTIVFASGLTGTITLDTANEGDIEISSELLIQGPGADLLTIDAGGSDRVFYLCTGSTAEFQGLTITGGSASEGGGIYDHCDDGFTLRDVVVTGNEATSGGGGGFYSGGSVTLINTVVSNNTATSYGGGGVSDDLTMVGSTISGNATSGDGGGGAYAAGNVSITSSTFDSNSTETCGGGLYSGVDRGTVTITDSTFSNNTAVNCYGGGIDIDGNGNIVVIANTTITGNSAVSGGGLAVDYDNDVSLFMNTISGNSATSTDALYSGGGIHMSGTQGQSDPPTLTMVGTIVSGNTAAAGPADFGVGNSGNAGPYAITVNDSLMGDSDSRLTVTGSGNVTSTTPGLGALANNGGPTKTMALLDTSPALDAGPSVIPTFIGNEFDQRGAGFARVVGTRADIGAFETQAPEPTPTTAPNGEVVPNFTG